MPTMSSSAGSSIFEKVVPNKIFAVDRFDNVDKMHNCSIGQLTDPLSLSYTSDLDLIVSVLHDPATAQYQDRLLEKAVFEISAEKVDIDNIRIGLLLTENDFEALFDKESGITVVKTKARRQRLKVKSKDIGAINKRYKKADLKPFFTKKYRIFVDQDEYRYLDIYLAESFHPYNSKKLSYNCILECIPSRLSLSHLSLMLFHFKSSLRPGRYDQLIKLGKLLRIDTGYVMHGISQLFAFTLHDSLRKGDCIPLEGNAAVETTYIGHKKYKPIIAYDKVLKENKTFMKEVFRHLSVRRRDALPQVPGFDQWFINQAASLRVESRDYKLKKTLSLTKLEKVKSGLTGVSFIRPTALQALSQNQLKRLLTDKRHEQVWSIHDHLKELHNAKNKEYLVKFDTAKVKAAFLPRLKELKQVLFEPSNSADFAKFTNYSASVIAVRNKLKPFVVAARKQQASKKEIVGAKERAIYVEGCAGAGKTDLIVSRVRALVKSGENPDNIAILAFTREATKEFIRRLKHENLLSKHMFVGTFSAWCKSELIGDDKLKVIKPEKAIEVIQELLRRTGRKPKKFEAEDLARNIVRMMSHAANFDKVDYQISIAAVAPQLTPFLKQTKKVIAAYQQWKTENKKVDFDDLLIKARANLFKKEHAGGKARQFSHILLDEVQDFNIIQWNIMEALYKAGSQFFCVGDPAQAMYGFRGANTDVLNRFEDVFKNGRRFYLLSNYRCSPEIVDLSNQIRAQINGNFRLSIATRKSSDTVRLKKENTVKSAACWLAADLQENPTKFNECLVLCRYNKHKEQVEAVLESTTLPTNFSYKVMTYHKAKGTEAENVYVLDPLLSNYRLGPKKEELCNAYVAFTRAKSRLTIIASYKGAVLYGTSKDKKVEDSIFAKLGTEFGDAFELI